MCNAMRRNSPASLPRVAHRSRTVKEETAACIGLHWFESNFAYIIFSHIKMHECLQNVTNKILELLFM